MTQAKILALIAFSFALIVAVLWLVGVLSEARTIVFLILDIALYLPLQALVG